MLIVGVCVGGRVSCPDSVSNIDCLREVTLAILLLGIVEQLAGSLVVLPCLDSLFIHVHRPSIHFIVKLGWATCERE